MTLLRLRLRRWFLGWGYHPDELRFLSLYLQRDARLCVLYAIFLPAILVVIQTINRRPVTLDFIVHVTLVLLILFLAIALLLLAVAFVYRRRARAATLNPEHLMGYRYGIAFDPPSPCYVRFGLTADIAKWYLVPLEWEEIISTALPDTPFELWVLPVTGWVERLRRGGTEPQEVSQPTLEPLPAGEAVPDEHTREEAGVDQPEDEGATREEARAMKRFARSAGLTWLATPQYLFWSWVCLMTEGLLICIGGAATAAWLVVTYPQMVHSDENRVGLTVSLILCEVGGLIVIVIALWWLAVWRRARRLDTAPVEATGEVVAWMRYRNWWGPSKIRQDQRREKLIQLRTADGTEQIFRLPPKLAHRAQRRGEHVRITYRVGNGHVLDVQHVEAPVQAAVTDGSA